MRSLLFGLGFAFFLSVNTAHAQWTNRYPKVEGRGHHVYLEQEDLPILGSGPTDPAPSPDGKHVAFSHQGWIWLLDLETSVATRLTNSAGIDGRPRWSPSGDRLTFVRDGGEDTAIIVRRLSDGNEDLIDTPAIDLDPAFSKTGDYLFYTSAQSGSPQIFRRHLESGLEEQVTQGRAMPRGARPAPDGKLLYIDQPASTRTVRLRDMRAGSDVLLAEQGWAPNASPDIHPNGQTIVYGIADGNGNRLALIDSDRPSLPRWLTSANDRALSPSFSADGAAVFYTQSNAKQQFELMKVAIVGGAPEKITIGEWDYGSAIGQLELIVADTEGSGLPARVAIAREDGHPVVNPYGATYTDIQNGYAYFYIDGSLNLDLPPGRYSVKAARGLFSEVAETEFRVQSGKTRKVSMALSFVWDAKAAGYVSLDHHVHLNASGAHDLALTDLLPLMAGEDIDHAAPMAWNQYNRFVDADGVGQVAEDNAGRVAVLSQEVRSDFHGHVGLIGAKEAYAPWFFGPTSPVFGTRDRTNGDAVAFANERGLLPTYVHPVDHHSDPFDDLDANAPPYELVLDGVLSRGVGIELVCMWTSPLGTAEVWYRFLNIGTPMPATSGTDMMANFYRTPAIGTARSYVPAENGRALFAEGIDKVRRGEGFLSTGPAVLFDIGGAVPGGTVQTGAQDFTLTVASVQPVTTVEIIVNGEVIETFEGVRAGQTRVYTGSVDLPSGGWIAARAHGGEPAWPSMAVTRFAHTAPIWIGEIGSTNDAVAKLAATELLSLLNFSSEKFLAAYDQAEIPKLTQRITQAKSVLKAITAE